MTTTTTEKEGEAEARTAIRRGLLATGAPLWERSLALLVLMVARLVDKIEREG